MRPDRLRVLHLIDTNIANLHLIEIAELGDTDRFDYVIGCLTGAGPLQQAMADYEVSTFALGCTGRRDYPRAALRLARFLRSSEVHVVQTHLFEPGLVGQVAAFLARVPVRLFTANHVSEWEVSRLGTRRAAVVDRIVRTRLATHVLAPSEYICSVLKQADRLPQRRLLVARHGVNLGRFSQRFDVAAVRRELGCEGRTVIGAVGRITPVKNYRAVLEALSRVVQAHPDILLLIAGDGARAELSQTVRELGLDQHVRLLGLRDDIPRLLTALDFLIQGSITETFGHVVTEALAAGVPVVATPVGIAPEVVETGRNGILLQGSSSYEIARGLIEMLRSRDRWPEMSIAASERARELTAERAVATLEALYDELWLRGHN